MQNVRMTASSNKILLQKPDFAFRITGVGWASAKREIPSSNSLHAK
jgi:hypothetical protein